MKLYCGRDEHNQMRGTVCDSAEEAYLILGEHVRHPRLVASHADLTVKALWSNPRREFIDAAENGQWRPTGAPPLSEKFYGYSDWQLQAAVSRLQSAWHAFFQTHTPPTPELTRVQRHLLSLQREQERRNAVAGRPVNWRILLEHDMTDTMLTGSALAAAVAQYDLHIEPPGIYFTETMQSRIDIRMVKGKPGQVQLVAHGLDELLPHIVPFRDGTRQFFLHAQGVRRRAKFWLTLAADGTVTLHGPPLEKNAFSDLRTALAYIQEHHYWQQRSDTASSTD